MHFVIVPGIDGSGPDHWQSLWQNAWGASATRIAPSSWTEPDLTDWCHALDRAADAYRAAGVVLVTGTSTPRADSGPGRRGGRC